jgi:hypothetical protein
MRDPLRARAFVERDWRALERDKERYWSAYKAEHGAAAGLTVADELRAQVRRARPDWPSEEERHEDLETHLRVLDVIGRVGRLGR